MIDDGGPAFPVPLDDFRDLEGHPATGMSRRDWFAGCTLKGFLSRESMPNEPDELRAMVQVVYIVADAMIAESKRTEETSDGKSEKKETPAKGG